MKRDALKFYRDLLGLFFYLLRTERNIVKEKRGKRVERKLKRIFPFLFLLIFIFEIFKSKL